jgi:hypothetical protein
MIITQEALNFLKGKSIYVYGEESTYIRLYVFEGKMFLLPNFMCDRHFFAKVCRQYKSWSSFFDKRRKQQFISLLFHVTNISIICLPHLSETTELLNSLDLKKIEAFKGFDPKGTFSSHSSSIGYGTTSFQNAINHRGSW